jgi:hypothetical protein
MFPFSKNSAFKKWSKFISYVDYLELLQKKHDEMEKEAINSTEILIFENKIICYKKKPTKIII